MLCCSVELETVGARQSLKLDVAPMGYGQAIVVVAVASGSEAEEVSRPLKRLNSLIYQLALTVRLRSTLAFAEHLSSSPLDVLYADTLCALYRPPLPTPAAPVQPPTL